MNTNNAAWFKEALNNPDTKSITTSKGDQHLIHKGFKISFVGGQYEIIDVRKQDFYSPVSKADMEVFHLHGFILGSNYLMYLRDCKRVILFNKSIEKLKTMLERFEEMFRSGNNVEFAKKRIRNCKENLTIRKELIADYTERRDRAQKRFKFSSYE